MSSWIELIMVSIVLMNLMMAGSSRISICIHIAAFQGVAAGLLPLLIKSHSPLFDTTIFAVVTVILKGCVFPRLLFRAQQQANIRRDIEPFIGYPMSMILCVLAFMISVWFSSRLPLPCPVFSNWAVPVAFSTILTGFLIIISRTKALIQVLGYLVMENGICVFGLALLFEQPLLVELAGLLDVFVAVFVMGITIFHISREFDHIDTYHLSQLKDSVR